MGSSLITKAEALEALQRIFNNCEEIDNHLPEEERSGYKMYSDYNIIWLYLTAPEERGKWIKMSDRDGVYWACSKCGYELPRFRHFDPQFDLFPSLKSTDKTDYCPFCGLHMENGE